MGLNLKRYVNCLRFYYSFSSPPFLSTFSPPPREGGGRDKPTKEYLCCHFNLTNIFARQMKNSDAYFYDRKSYGI